MTDWSRYQACTVCDAGLGEPCLVLFGRNADGRVAVESDEAHSTRKLRLTTRPRPNGDH